MKSESVKVGFGVIIVNSAGEILIGKRTGSHAQKYSIPGGKVEMGETFEDAAIREIKEETDLNIVNPQVVAVTNNLETFRAEGIHYISIILLVKQFGGREKVMEPNKCEAWSWCDPKNLPEPHFDASKRGIDCWLGGVFYKKYE